MRAGDSARHFYQRRFARIAPSYWVAALLGVVVVALTGTLTTTELLRIAPSAVFAQSWFPDRAVYWAGNGVGWSLSTELLFYLTFPLFAPPLARLTTGQLQGGLAASLGLAVTVPATLAHLAPEEVAPWMVDIFPPVRLLEFVAGAAIGLLLRRNALPYVRLPVAVVVALVSYVVVVVAPDQLTRPIMVVPLSLLLIAAAQGDLAGRASLLRHRWFIKLGEWSFCFYLVHQLVYKVVHHFLPVDGAAAADHVARIILLVGTFVLATAAGAALHRFVEVPAEARLRPRRQHGAGGLASASQQISGRGTQAIS